MYDLKLVKNQTILKKRVFHNKKINKKKISNVISLPPTLKSRNGWKTCQPEIQREAPKLSALGYQPSRTAIVCNCSVKSNTNGATSRWSRGCHPRGTAWHALFLKPLECLSKHSKMFGQNNLRTGPKAARYSKQLFGKRTVLTSRLKIKDIL